MIPRLVVVWAFPCLIILWCYPVIDDLRRFGPLRLQSKYEEAAIFGYDRF